LADLAGPDSALTDTADMGDDYYKVAYSAGARVHSDSWGQGLALVHFSAQLERFLWDRGCVEGLYRGY